jgi:hypothetical protein
MEAQSKKILFAKAAGRTPYPPAAGMDDRLDKKPGAVYVIDGLLSTDHPAGRRCRQWSDSL